MEYKILVDKYIAVIDNYRELANEVQEQQKEKGTVDEELHHEYIAFKATKEKLEKTGLELYQKQPKDMYGDGWKFWTEDDKRLREERYGKK